MPKRTHRRRKHGKRQRRKHRKTRRHLKGGDYRVATQVTINDMPLPLSAGVSIPGQSGVLNLKQLANLKERELFGERPFN